VAANASPIGCIGRLTVATRAADGPGEVLILLGGGREAYLASSDAGSPRRSTCAADVLGLAQQTAEAEKYARSIASSHCGGATRYAGPYSN
jgi:hypothetical protein